MKKKISQITNNSGNALAAMLGGEEPIKGYTPSTVEQRANWNRFLSFLRVNYPFAKDKWASKDQSND